MRITVLAATALLAAAPVVCLAAPAAAECQPVLADNGQQCANDCDDNVYQQADRRLHDALPDTICTQG